MAVALILQKDCTLPPNPQNYGLIVVLSLAPCQASAHLEMVTLQKYHRLRFPAKLTSSATLTLVR